MAPPQNSTIIDRDEFVDDISSTATSEKILSNKCMRDLANDYSPILRPKSAGDHRLQHNYVQNVPFTIVTGIHIPPSTQKKSIFDKNIIRTSDEEVCTIHSHDLILFFMSICYIIH